MRQSGPVTIDILDLSGRRVRSLVRATTFGAGRQQVEFDGRGDSGQRLEAGVYFYRLRIPFQTWTQRFTMLR